MITPRSLSGAVGAVRAMCGRTWRIRSIVPRTLTFITKSKSERENGFRLRSRICGVFSDASSFRKKNELGLNAPRKGRKTREGASREGVEKHHVLNGLKRFSEIYLNQTVA